MARRSAKAKGEGKALLDEAGIDEICARLRSGDTLTRIAADVGVGKATLLDWIAADADRSARVRESRTAAAAMYEEQAQEGIEAAADPFELAKAKELAHHLRWRASKVNPREYGDKLDVTQTTTIRDETDEALLARAEKLRALLSK